MIKGKGLFTVLMALALLLIFGAMVPNAFAAKVKVLIGFKHQPGLAEQSLVHRAGGRIKYTYHIIPAIAATVPETAISGLRRNPNVTCVELDGKVHPLHETLPWGVNRIDAEVPHQLPNKGTGVKIAVIDSGIDYTHPDLDENYMGGWDFVNDDPDPMDDHGHGTMVSGIIAGEANGIGVIGVAPEAHLYALKVIPAEGYGTWSDVIAALEWSVDNGMQVVSMSIGGSQDPGELVKQACDTAYNAGLVLVAAAGNEGTRDGTGDNVIYPAKFDSVIAVAGTDPYDQRVSYSSTGPDVELAAPTHVATTELGGGYRTGTGTSAACPHVSGVAALVIASGVTDGDGGYGVANEVRVILGNTADDIGDPGRDPWYGYGLVDAEEASLGTQLGDDLPEGHDVAVVAVHAPSEVTGGEVVPVDVDVVNEGTYTERIRLILTVGGERIGQKRVQLDAGRLKTLTFDWDTGGLSEGYYTLTAEASVVKGEADTADNSESTTVYVRGAPTGGTMHIASVEVSCKSVTRGPNIWVYAEATVKIVDDNGLPVKDAEVAGSWSGATTDSDSGLTDGSGLVTFKSDKIRNPTDPLTFTFTVNSVAKAGWTWDGVEKSGSDTWYPSAAPALIVYPTGLGKAYPNPGNPEVWIPFTLSKTEHVIIRIYDVNGRLVKVLDLDRKSPGAYVTSGKAAYWDGRNEKGERVSSGIYFYVMEAGSFRTARKMVISK
jgi:hypothetical protein